ncbi:MAG: hypothetical protein ACOWYE_07570 [Desulfatiglandales bacterium]
MNHDPFGDLGDWGSVLEVFGQLADNGKLTECQPGLVRILKYKGNWRLREEVLKRVGEIENASDELVFQVLSMLDDDNIYYDARVLAGDALTQLAKNVRGGLNNEINSSIRKVAEKLITTPQPPFFGKALKRLCSEIRLPTMV